MKATSKPLSRAAWVFLLAIILAQLSICFADTTINANHHLSYGGNIGWLDWRGDTTNGAVIGNNFCSGYIYGANVGWINLGSGSPANGSSYQNNSSSDFGVNLDGSGNLSGYAWGANIGWLTFTNRDADGNVFDGPKIDPSTGNFSGYIWSANCGWISLSNAQAYVQTGAIISPGALTVSPADGLTASGNMGGPFTPNSRDYALSNSGPGSLTWTASKTEGWITLSSVSGSLAAGGTTNVSVSINGNASSLGGGVYSDTVTFINASSGAGNTTRPVSLTIRTGLNVGGIWLISSGPVGGPFSPADQAYDLRNLSGTPLNWTATKAANWLSLSQTSGTLAPGQTTTVLASINTNASNLPEGGYADQILFTNSTDGVGSQTMWAIVTVGNSPPIIIEPPGHFTLSPGGTATFSVTAVGDAPLFYRWRHGTNDLPGENASTLTLANISTAQVGHYSVVVSNVHGAVTSLFGTAALLTLKFNTNPVLELSAEVGDPYRIDYVGNLNTNDWTSLRYFTVHESPFSITDTNAAGSSMRFYRAIYYQSPFTPP